MTSSVKCGSSIRRWTCRVMPSESTASTRRQRCTHVQSSPPSASLASGCIIASTSVTISTRLSAGSHFIDSRILFDSGAHRVNTRSIFMATKMLSLRTGDAAMDTKIADRAIVAIQVIRWMAIIIVMGLISTVIGVSIYTSLGIAH